MLRRTNTVDRTSGPCGSLIPQRFLLGEEILTHMAPLARQGRRDKFVQCTTPVEPGQDDQVFHCKVKIWHSWGQYLGHEPKEAILG